MRSNMKTKNNIGISIVGVWGRKGRSKQSSEFHLNFHVHLASIWGVEGESETKGLGITHILHYNHSSDTVCRHEEQLSIFDVHKKGGVKEYFSICPHNNN